ncbi:MAG: DUF1573 domain-containing protein [Fusobacteriaceae bacterium]
MLLTVNKTHADLGKVKHRSDTHFSYSFTNNSRYRLTPGISLGCNSCTSASFKIPYIDPGQTQELNCLYNGNDGVGTKAVKSLKIVYNNPDLNQAVETISLTFSFEVI